MCRVGMMCGRDAQRRCAPTSAAVWRYCGWRNEEWGRTAVLRPYVRLDEFVVMLYRVHGVIVLMGDDTVVGMDTNTLASVVAGVGTGLRPAPTYFIGGWVSRTWVARFRTDYSLVNLSPLWPENSLHGNGEWPRPLGPHRQ